MVRGVVGLGVIGGAIGAVLGGAWGGFTAVLAGFFPDPGYLRFVWAMVLGNAMGFGMIGAFTASGFGVILALTDARRSLDELPLWRMGLFGALAAAAFPPLFVIGTAGWSDYLAAAEYLVPTSLWLGALGGGGTMTLVAIAKRAGRDELPPGTASTPELPGQRPDPT